MTHTATPWHIPTTHGTAGAIAFASGYIGFTCAPRKTDESRTEGESWLAMRERTQDERDAIEREQEANREFIVRACNAHDDLVAALTLAAQSAGFQYMLEETRNAIDAALAKATT